MKIKYSILVFMVALFAVSCSNDDDGGKDLEAQDVAGEWTLKSYSKDHSETTVNDDGEASTIEGRETLSEGNVSLSLIKSGELVVTYQEAVFEDQFTKDGEEQTLTSKPKSTELGSWRLLSEEGQIAIKGFRDFKTETVMDIINYSESQIELQADLSPKSESENEDEENENITTYKLVLVRK